MCRPASWPSRCYPRSSLSWPLACFALLATVVSLAGSAVGFQRALASYRSASS